MESSQSCKPNPQTFTKDIWSNVREVSVAALVKAPPSLGRSTVSSRPVPRTRSPLIAADRR